ncbi:MAG: hypothetical protein EXS24_01640 [Pedosphaera sp.]|nr:hypothetical protein [Pedosphaera sp.]
MNPLSRLLPALLITATPILADSLADWLAKPIIGPDLALAEVQAYTEARVAKMPVAKSADDWQREAASIRKSVLENVVFRDETSRGWRNAKGPVQWMETIEGLPGYRIKKLRFEMLPGWWIPALLYEPLELKGKVPVHLAVNGHDGKGKAADYKQTRCINLAKRGMIALNVEWIGMGQFAGRMGHYQMNQLDLCGASGIAPFYLNMSRALDVLLAHPNADPARVAVSGLSGGGWQTIFISSLDTRVKLANPVAGYSSFLTRARHFSDLGDSEQTPNDLALHADYTHLTALLADRAALLTFNAKDNCCFASGHALQPLIDAAGPMFEQLGRRDHLRWHINHVPGDHNFGQENREQFYKMVSDEFSPGKPADPKEIPSANEIKTSADLTVPLPTNNLAFNTIALSLIKSLPKPLPNGKPAQTALLQSVLRLEKEMPLTAQKVGTEMADGLTATFWKLSLDREWTVPCVVISPEKPKATALVLLDSGRSSSAEPVRALLKENTRVVVLDPFYFGEAKIKSHSFLFALLVASVGERPLGIQSAQVAAAARWANAEFKLGPNALTLVSHGPRMSVIASCSAVLEPKAIGALELHQPLKSLKQVVENNWGVDKFPELFCFGLLERFDLPQIHALIAPRSVKSH